MEQGVVAQGMTRGGIQIYRHGGIRVDRAASDDTPGNLEDAQRKYPGACSNFLRLDSDEKSMSLEESSRLCPTGRAESLKVESEARACSTKRKVDKKYAKILRLLRFAKEEW